MTTVHRKLERSRAQSSGRLLLDLGETYTLELTPDAWFDVADHPRQRDADRQVRKHHWRLAQRARGPLLHQQRFVVGAEFEGRIFKVDGHARALLWASGTLTRPDSVICTVHRCATREQLVELINAFDSQDAAQTAFDRVTGAYRECGLDLKSKRLRGGTIVDALAIASRGVARSKDKSVEGADFDVYDAVRRFADELQMLDGIDPQPEVFHTGVVAAALLALAMNPQTLGFFESLGARRGRRQGDLSDPVQGVLNVLERLKSRRAGWEKSAQESLCAMTLRAALAYLEGEASMDFWCSAAPAPVDLPMIVERVAESKRIPATA